MLTISTDEAETHLSRYLAAVEQGEEIVIARGEKPVAKLVLIGSGARVPRPKVGQILGEPFEFPAAAFAPLTEEELKAWGW